MFNKDYIMRDLPPCKYTIIERKEEAVYTQSRKLKHPTTRNRTVLRVENPDVSLDKKKSRKRWGKKQ